MPVPTSAQVGMPVTVIGGDAIEDSQMVVGAGTNYTLTGAFAHVVFGAASLDVVLPVAGRYFLSAVLTYQADVKGLADIVQARFQNVTDSVAVGVAPAVVASLASGFETLTLTASVVITASKNIQIFAVNGAAARGLIYATNSSITWIRL